MGLLVSVTLYKQSKALISAMDIFKDKNKHNIVQESILLETNETIKNLSKCKTYIFLPRLLFLNDHHLQISPNVLVLKNLK